MTQLPELLRQHEVAKLLRLPKITVQRYAKRGVLTPIKDGGRAVYYSREQVVGLAELRKK
jgi:DNA-binding transcriptional MerR regulator